MLSFRVSADEYMEFKQYCKEKNIGSSLLLRVALQSALHIKIDPLEVRLEALQYRLDTLSEDLAKMKQEFTYKKA